MGNVKPGRGFRVPMLEVEVKASVPDVETVRRLLRSLGAKRVLVERERDDYFRHPQRDFRRTDEALRLRFRDGSRREAELTYKGPKFDRQSKSRVELSVSADGPAAEALFGALGFRKHARVLKRREEWTVGRATVALDRVEGLGEFVEVERIVDARPGSREFAAARDECLRLLRALGLRGSERRSYLELLENRRHGRRKR